MGLGVLNAGDGHVPGTSFVLESAGQQPEHIDISNSRLKYDRSGKDPIVLVPQPSDDPNDPLNWPLWKRDVILLILCLMSLIASTLSPLLAANTLTLALELEVDFTHAALLTGYHLCGVGVAGVIFVASARVWGKRHLYLLGTVLIIISSAWGGASTSYNSLVWARIIQGVGLAPFEALVNATVGDMYFVHQRGLRMALSNMSLFGGAFFTPIIVGKITDTMGWPWSFYFISIFAGMMLPFLIFYCPETAFRRSEEFNTDSTGQGNAQEQAPVATPIHDAAVEKPSPTHSAHGSGSTSFDNQPAQPNDEQAAIHEQAVIPPKMSYVQSLKLFNGRKTDDSLFKLILRPFPLFLHPAIVWGCLIQGALIGWTVLIGVVLAGIFFGPPLWLDEAHIGYLYTGAFIGAVLGFLVAGGLADWSTQLMIRRNKGVYEPEFRIVLVIAQLIFGCAGIFGFGITANNVYLYGQYVPDVFFGLEVMGMVIGAVASALYIVDAHRDIAVEAFTTLMIFKNIFSFGLTWVGYDWLTIDGTQKVFLTIGGIQVAICFLSVPMYVFGKKNREFFHRNDLLKKTGLW